MTARALPRFARSAKVVGSTAITGGNADGAGLAICDRGGARRRAGGELCDHSAGSGQGRGRNRRIGQRCAVLHRLRQGFLQRRRLGRRPDRARFGCGVRFMDTNEFYPNQQISVIFFSDKFATERKEVAEKFMRAWLRGVRSYNDAIKDGKIAGAGADEVVAIMAKSFNMNPALIREMYSQAVDVTGAVNAAGVQKDLDFFLQQGWVTGQIKASDVIDMSFARKASAELGPYQRKSP